jgi:NADH:ubiquinone oxidoreductase subunit
MRIILFFLIAIGSIHLSVGQSGLTDEMKETEEQLRASTKQINQFFRRFNGEEDEAGNRYYETDKRYRDPSLRRKYLTILFDNQTSSIDPGVSKDFVKKITSKDSPSFLDFHSGDWFAEVNANFTFKGKEISGLLYMRLQAQGQGYEWIIEDVAFDQFQKYFKKDTSENKRFMHPMSHELDFMTLRKAFLNDKHAEQFTSRNYEPDFLTLFIYEMNQGNLKFVTVKNVAFHFFAIDGYYFSLSNYNRPGYNSGWLISNLVPLANEDQKQQMKRYIYDKH